jgi:hypothetical protein
MCTIARQHFTKEQPIRYYTYCFKDKTENGKPCERPQYKMAVGPGGCPHC